MSVTADIEQLKCKNGCCLMDVYVGLEWQSVMGHDAVLCTQCD